MYRSVMFASATVLPYADASFNTVISNCVIEHIPDNDAVLAEIFRVLRPGGVFATTLPSELSRIPTRRNDISGGGPPLFGARLRPLLQPHFQPLSCLLAPGLARTVDCCRIRDPGADVLFLGGSTSTFRFEPLPGRPNLVTKRLFGRWVIFDGQMKLFEHWLRPYFEEPLPDSGAYQFVQCRKKAR